MPKHSESIKYLVNNIIFVSNSINYFYTMMDKQIIIVGNKNKRGPFDKSRPLIFLTITFFV